MTRTNATSSQLPSLGQGQLTVDGAALLRSMPAGVSAVPDPQGAGLFFRFTAENDQARQVFPLGELAGLARFTAHYRFEPFWMVACAGTRAGQVPPETQFLLVETAGGGCVALVPLVDGPFRACLQGQGEYGLALVAETGDSAVTGHELTGLFLAAGDDPYSLVTTAARSVMRWLGTGRLREEKRLPAFVDQFGWCTWDAFYSEVSHDKVRAGLASLAAGGVQPRLLILDDGWQPVRPLPDGQLALTGFAANEKFPGDLVPTVRMAKDEYGVETFLVWHTMNGYWGGVDPAAFPAYPVRVQPRAFSPEIRAAMPAAETHWGRAVGVVAPEAIYRFFHDYHRHLRRQGVDGVKADNQAVLEGVAQGLGGRVALMRAYREALEGAAQTHFSGALINCMSCSNEMLYGALNSTLTRTSTDFWPDRPWTHGLHLYANAQVGLWFGQFVHPDWDMFQSGHPAGAFHAAARAVSGGPVYVSDKPGTHDFGLLRKLVLPDGTVLRARRPGLPARDCLFHDPTREAVLLKVFNHNAAGGVVGAFNARYDPDRPGEPMVGGAVRPADVEGLDGERFAVYAHYGREVRVLAREEPWPLALPPLGSELFTITPIERGVASLGLVEMFNSGGAVLEAGWCGETYEVTFRGAGRFSLWSERSPQAVAVDGAPAAFAYSPATGLIEVGVGGVATSGLIEYRF